MKRCKNCGELNPPKTLFCFHCGSTNFFETGDVVCPVCGESNDPSFGYCLQCGAKLPEKSETPLTENSVLTDANESDYIACPFCNSSIPLDTVYCPNCGKDVSEYNSDRRVKKAVCINCGHVNDIGNPYCSYCFADLSKAVTADYEVTFVEKEKLEDMRVLQAVLNGGEDEKIICPACRAINDADELYCEQCGKLLTVETPKKYCFVCGAENNYNARFCTNCQFPFEGKQQEDAAADAEWICDCGAKNGADAEFCIDCGKSKADLGKDTSEVGERNESKQL